MAASDSPPTVVVPSLDGTRTRELLASLARQTVAVQAIVVDNGSDAQAVSRACAGFEFAAAIRSESNLGFGRAVNLGAGRAEGSVLIVGNDDVAYDAGFVERLASGLDPKAGVMMAAGVLRDHDDPTLVDTAGVGADHTLWAFDYLNGEALSVLAAGPADPLGPSGGAAAFVREAFLEVGGFDPRIFAYLEDLDLALRMRLRGWRCRLVADALGTHHHSATLGAGSPRKNYLMGFGRGYTLRKWRVMTIGRLLPVMAREIPVCAGQIALDRTSSGIRGRIAGWRAAEAAGAYPGELALATAPSLRESLRARLARRRRVRRSG